MAFRESFAMPEWISTRPRMESAAGSNPPAPSFLEFVVYLLPFQIKKFGLRNPGYPQIPERFFTKEKVR